MSLLQQIQESVVEEDCDLGSILLKLRLLASRLGSDVLEDWVRYESEGYPRDVDLPSYRIVGATFRGTFMGPMGGGIKNAQIPGYLVEKYAGESWTKFQVRESIASIDNMIKDSASGGTFGFDASNLILILNGKIYEGHSCNDVSATISSTSFHEIKQTVRNRILELTIELEKSVPGALNVTFGSNNSDAKEIAQVQRITQQVIYGDVNNAVVDGRGANINVSVNERDANSLIEQLVSHGIDENDARELALIMESEEPSSENEPFGEKANNWFVDNIKKASSGVWNVGLSVAKRVLEEAALQYYGLK